MNNKHELRERLRQVSPRPSNLFDYVCRRLAVSPPWQRAWDQSDLLILEDLREWLEQERAGGRLPPHLTEEADKATRRLLQRCWIEPNPEKADDFVRQLDQLIRWEPAVRDDATVVASCFCLYPPSPGKAAMLRLKRWLKAEQRSALMPEQRSAPMPARVVVPGTGRAKPDLELWDAAARRVMGGGR